MMLLDELTSQTLGRQRQNQTFKPDPWLGLNNEIASGSGSTAQFAGRGDRHRSEGPMKLVGQYVMAFGALFRNQRLDRSG